MKISNLFDLHQGNSLELLNMDIDKDTQINFVSRTGQNNGVVAQVKPIEGKEAFSAGAITVALSGSVLSSFVQVKSFYTAFHIMVLIPKVEMRLEDKLFYCHCIKMNAYRYRYGRQANKTLENIELPVLPKWLKLYNIDYSRIITTIKQIDVPLQLKQWKEFRLGDLFNIVNGIKYPAEWRKSGSLPLISTTAINNGVSAYIADRAEKYQNILTVAYSGSVGATFYQGRKIFIGETVFGLIPKFSLNKYIGIFLCSILNFYNKRYDYGRKIIGTRYVNDILKLPATLENTPNWQFMENYIKALPNSDKI
ncbi:restriction endonuclease subunit S [Treponema endosymbiont of Eucomonympha sp.]|uniref:restriction endonuclease subunit S n=1 Tax=Treponema endosymbiont of Eucomonympha sp. TaxID=1580831 RepID=UPI000AF8236A|nr:restriction endonuclease subunit S [Treponema endosymbiont of Eucomonympha sp.]